jgi:hypothetical protein
VRRYFEEILVSWVDSAWVLTHVEVLDNELPLLQLYKRTLSRMGVGKDFRRLRTETLKRKFYIHYSSRYIAATQQYSRK